MDRLMHTPEGVRDIYNVECGKKLALEERIKKIIHLYGYKDIQTPTFEFFDVFGKEVGTTPEKELYRFFDKEGNTLALRPDITPSVARAAATLYNAEELPIRLCYTGNTFVNHSNYQGRLREMTQMGVELIGDGTVEADAEMLALAIETMLSVGVKEFQLTLGNVEFLRSLLDDAGLSDAERNRVLELINNRNFFGVESYLDNLSVSSSVKESFRMLHELVGGVEVLSKARDCALTSSGIMAVKRLERIYQILEIYGVEKYVTFDFGMTGIHGYYTGIIFRGYTYGTGDAIIKGGRYDHLLEKFGKKSPSIGFVIMIDELMNAMLRQKIRMVYPRKNVIVLYEENRFQDAVLIAKDLRSKSRNAELLKKEKERLLEDYISYGIEYYAGSIIYIKSYGDITMYDLVTGEQKEITR